MVTSDPLCYHLFWVVLTIHFLECSEVATVPKYTIYYTHNLFKKSNLATTQETVFVDKSRHYSVHLAPKM